MGAGPDDLAHPPATAETHQGSAGGAPRPRGRRLWLFRLTALVVVPALLLLIFELALRLAGFRYATGFARRISVNGDTVHVRNTDFPRRLFDQTLRISPDNPGIRTNLAGALARAGTLLVAGSDQRRP